MKKHLTTLFFLFLFALPAMPQTSVSADSLSKHVFILASDSLQGRSPGTKGCVAAADYIENALKNMGVKPLLEDYFHPFVFRNGVNSIEAKNILGLIEGTDALLKNEYIVIGAHYDHIGYFYKSEAKEPVVFNGADDNASGVATLLELARILNQKPPKRSIIIAAWDAEESGLLGSYQFVHDSLVNLRNIKLALSIDMVGMLEKAKGLNLPGLETLVIDKDSLLHLAHSFAIEIIKTSDRVPNRTDTKPFGELGIPAIQITTGTVSPYHKPEDDANLLDYNGMVSIAEFTHAFIASQANKQEELISAIKPTGTEHEKQIKAGFRMNIGSNHHVYANSFYKSKTGFAFNLGLYSQIKINPLLSVQPEITYENKTTPHALGNLNTQALNYDLNLLICTNTNPNPDVKAFALLGVYYAKIFKGSIEWSTEPYQNLFRNEDYGVNWGLGMDIYFMQLGFTQKIGADYLNKEILSADFYTISSYFTIGYTF